MPKPMRMTTVDLTKELGNDADAQMSLENRYMEFEALQTQAVEARRDAAVAMAEATIAEQRAAQSFVKFLRFAGDHADIVKREAIWLPPFRSKGAIVLQSPMTRRDQRVAANLMHTELSERASEKLDFGSDGDMYDDSEDNQ